MSYHCKFLQLLNFLQTKSSLVIILSSLDSMNMETGDNPNLLTVIKDEHYASTYYDEEVNIKQENPSDPTATKFVSSYFTPFESNKEGNIKQEPANCIGDLKTIIKCEPIEIHVIKPEADCLKFWSRREKKIDERDIAIRQETNLSESQFSQASSKHSQLVTPQQMSDNDIDFSDAYTHVQSKRIKTE